MTNHTIGPTTDGTEADDPYRWLEEVDGDRALAWVRARNAETEAALEPRPEFEAIRRRLLAILNAKERIPSISRRGDWFYNLWQDEDHPRGLWRRTTLDDYRRDEPSWETVLDLDALGAAEGENWVWGGAVGLEPDHRRCLLMLSRGGADAHVVREFDTVEKTFVDGGFALEEAKSDVDWEDADTLIVGTDVGPGSMTRSGYPRVLKRWRRGMPLASAETVFEAEADDLSATVAIDTTPGHERTLFIRALDFYEQEHWLREADGTLVRIDVPDDASIAFWHSAGRPESTLLIELRSDWTLDGIDHPGGTLLAADARAWLVGDRRAEALFVPTATRSLAGWTATRERLIVELLDDVASRLELWHRAPGGGFTMRPIDAPHPGSLGADALHDPMRADDPLAETWLLSYDDFLTPETLWLADAETGAREVLKTMPPRFDGSGLRVAQHFATSADGTRVPYFEIARAAPAAGTGGAPSGAAMSASDVATARGGADDAPTTAAPGPTLLYGYGGFEVSMEPGYRALWGAGWLERGGTLVVANIRGGGEYGPAWHQAAILEGKQRSYDDFIAVAEHLIARGVTTPARLGIEGGSNGGLLVGAVTVQRPDLFGAVVCAVPLLDMRRYHTLLAGASWMAEYGDPDDPEDWAFISRYSPYQNVREGVAYPPILFTTSTRDDRVHPGHARKMAAKLLALGQPVRYFENIEGGHGGAADNAQRARVQALELTFLWERLGSASAATRAGEAPGAAGGDTRSADGAPVPPDAAAVLDFWFATPGHPEHGRPRPLWFTKSADTDRAIADRFGPLIDRALAGGLDDWDATPRGALARVLLLDQFTRNVHRDTPGAFAGDRTALALATRLVETGTHLRLPPVERAFVYLPFEHAEDLAEQDRAVALFDALAAEAPELDEMRDYAERHRAVIRRFGRFPHRNAILGRPSTDEEVGFLREPGSSF